MLSGMMPPYLNLSILGIRSIVLLIRWAASVPFMNDLRLGAICPTHVPPKLTTKMTITASIASSLPLATCLDANQNANAYPPR